MQYETQIRNSRVLVVDDLVANVSLLENVLQRLGYKNFRGVTDPREVFAIVEEWQPDLIILDLAMPYLTGFEILEGLRSKEAQEEWIPVLILSGETDPGTKRKALAAGATEFLAKPFDTSEVILRIRNLLLMRILHSELRDQNRVLEQKVVERTKTLRERTAELEQALSELTQTQKQLVQQERLRAFGEMAGGVAHDFNNVLLCVIGYTDLILENPAILEKKETALGFMQTMNTAGHDASRIVARLREFYRPRDQSEILVLVSMNGLIEEVIPLTQPKWKAQAMATGRVIDLELDLMELPPVSCHPAEIREVIVNLIFNAVDAMPQGGTITLRTRYTQRGVSIGVSDTGTGMTEEVRQRCMEPFFSTKGDTGTGLGLAMVFGIIKRHDGTVEVESEVGKGTTVWIYLHAHAGEIAGVYDEEIQLGRSLRILAVDDDPMARDVVGRYLEADGHEVVSAASGAEAMELFKSETFDLVITDHVMPGMTGIQLAGAIRSASEHQPIILLTGYSDPAFDLAPAAAGVDTVSKTVTRRDLRHAIAKLMGAGSRPSDTDGAGGVVPDACAAEPHRNLNPNAEPLAIS